MRAGRVGAAIGIATVLSAPIFVGVVSAGPAAAATQDFTAPGTYEVTAPPGSTCATFVVDGAHGGAGNTLADIPTGAVGDPGSGGGGGSSFASSTSLSSSFGVAPGSTDGAIQVTFTSGECPVPPPAPLPPLPPAATDVVMVQPRFTG